MYTIVLWFYKYTSTEIPWNLQYESDLMFLMWLLSYYCYNVILPDSQESVSFGL